MAVVVLTLWAHMLILGASHHVMVLFRPCACSLCAHVGSLSVCALDALGVRLATAPVVRDGRAALRCASSINSIGVLSERGWFSGSFVAVTIKNELSVDI